MGEGNTIREEKLSVFHGSSGLHAGTLTLTEEFNRNLIRTRWTWTWIGGPFGRLGGIPRWGRFPVKTLPGLPIVTFMNSLMIFLDPDEAATRYRGPRAVTSSLWEKDPAPPLSRPYFRRGDTIQLVDLDFRTTESPGGHVFKCKAI